MHASYAYQYVHACTFIPPEHCVTMHYKNNLFSSYFTSVSKLVEGENSDQASQVLPEFVWLLRDVDCIPTSADGKELPPTDYLTSVLQKNKSCSTSSTLLQHFPTIQCFTIPPPSADGDILADITANVECLTPLFNQKVDGTIQWLLDNVRAKVVGSSATKCDGKMLACLLEQYFTQISKCSDKIPNFQVSWLKAIELRFMKLADSLVSEYDRDMQAQLEGKLPMVEGTNGETGETLMNIHLQVFAKKRLQFHKDILPFHLSKQSELGTNLLSYFDRSISESVKKGDHDQVIGGRLFNFIQANIKSSEKYCVAVYNEEYNKTVRPKVENALLAQIPVTIEEELTLFCNDYYRLAKGPAADEIFKQLRTESVRFEEELSLIPGPVRDLKVVGADSNRMKLRWEPPEVNAAAVEKYMAMIKSKGKNWAEVASQKKGKRSSLITGLQSNTWYCFTVLAKGQKYTGNQVSLVKAKTGISDGALGAAAVFASPITLPRNMNKWCTSYDRTENFFLVAASPVIGAVPVVGQIMGYLMYRVAKEEEQYCLLREQDAEVLHWTPPSSTEAKTDHEGLNSCVIDVPDDTEDLKNCVAIVGNNLEDSGEEN